MATVRSARSFATAGKLGYLTSRGRTRRRLTRPIHPCHLDAARQPLVFIHGYFGRTGMWLPLLVRLQEAGYDHLKAVSYNVLADPAPLVATKLARKILEVSQQHGDAAVTVIGHSMGGVVALETLIRHRNAAARVGKVITLGTPYAGAPLGRLGRLGPTRALRTARQLEPGSVHLAELRAAATLLDVPWSVLWSATDGVVPARSATAMVGPLVEHRRLPDLGHVEMLLSRRVAAIVLAELGGRRTLALPAA